MLNDLSKLKQAILYANKDREDNDRAAEYDSSSASAMKYQLVDALPYNPDKNTIYGLRDGKGKVRNFIWLDGYQEVSEKDACENRDDMDVLLYSLVQSTAKDGEIPADMARLGKFASIMNSLPSIKK